MSSYYIQFQKGMSEPQFDVFYGTKVKCWAALVELRWPNGFECPNCGGVNTASLDRENFSNVRGAGVKPPCLPARFSLRQNCR